MSEPAPDAGARVLTAVLWWLLRSRDSCRRSAGGNRNVPDTKGVISRNDGGMAAVYASVDRLGAGPIRGTDVQQQRTTRSSDLEALAFVVAVFGLLLVLALTLGSPIA